MDEQTVLSLIQTQTDRSDACRNEVHRKLGEMEAHFMEQDKTREDMKATLDMVLAQAKANSKEFKIHTEEEMDKYDEILTSMARLTDTMEILIKDTAKNTKYVDTEVQSRVFNKEMEKRVAEAKFELEEPIREEKARRDAIVNKIKMTAIGIVTTAIVVGTGSAIYAGFKMWVTLGMDKM